MFVLFLLSMLSMKHYIHLNNNQLVSIIHYTIFKTNKKVKLFMRLLDMSSTACVRADWFS